MVASNSPGGASALGHKETFGEAPDWRSVGFVIDPKGTVVSGYLRSSPGSALP